MMLIAFFAFGCNLLAGVPEQERFSGGGLSVDVPAGGSCEERKVAVRSSERETLSLGGGLAAHPGETWSTVECKDAAGNVLLAAGWSRASVPDLTARVDSDVALNAYVERAGTASTAVADLSKVESIAHVQSVWIAGNELNRQLRIVAADGSLYYAAAIAFESDIALGAAWLDSVTFDGLHSR